MTFKKGDTVRRVKRTEVSNPDYNYNGMPVGTEAVVTDVHSTNSGLTLEGWGDGHAPNKFELVSPKFRRGDTVRHLESRSEYVVDMVKPDGRLIFENYELVGSFEPEYYELISAASLDPAAVKAGDTVTVSVDLVGKYSTPKPFEVSGEVWQDDRDDPHGPVLRVGTYWLNSPEVIVTDHQPAPEPEPQRKPGTVALVDFPGDTEQRNATFFGGDYRQGVWQALDGYTDGYGDEVTVVRPLVVIDRAKIDPEALTQRVRQSTKGHSVWDLRDTVNALLSELGIKE